jgi:putative endonuclease
MTRDLVKRVWEHKIKAIPGFAARYGVDRLVWYEQHASLESAFARERQIKEWKRAWKIQLIETDNPQWVHLYPSIVK